MGGNRIQVSIAGLQFTLRKAEVADFLNTSGMPEIFTLESKQPEVETLIHSIEYDPDDDQNLKQTLIQNCLINLKASWFKYRGFRSALSLDVVLSNPVILDYVYQKLIMFSVGIVPELRINRSKAIDIYTLYKGQNYATAYFGNNVLGKIAEYAFNMVIHNAGVIEENKRIREAALYGG